MAETPSAAADEISMTNGKAHAVQADMRTLVRDAQALFQSATALSGDKADEMRGRAMDMLDQALGRAQQVRSRAAVRGRELANSADGYVRENPWRTAVAAAGVGVVLGMLIARQ
jgi:ElaB/YqjD/DUF883 family membrane-anchored ribosome-binding protein